MGGDGIFTYTLTNNPYSFEYIDSAYKKLPQSNGWIDAKILKESYVVEKYDQFNYSFVYFHQRIDNHPLLYYSLVHTVCSLFPGQYSELFTMIVNLICILGMDILLIKLFESIFGKTYYTIVPFSFLFFLLIMQQLYILSRMYMMLSFFCCWYLYIHWNLLNNKNMKKSSLIQMAICILSGTQTHYYFYVFAGCVTLIMLVYLLKQKKINTLFWYIYSGVVSIAVSWIIFPWIIWHVFFNQMQKHTEVSRWSWDKLERCISFLNDKLFNGNGVIVILTLIVLILLVLFKKKKQTQTVCTQTERILFLGLSIGSSILYSFIIFPWMKMYGIILRRFISPLLYGFLFW